MNSGFSEDEIVPIPKEGKQLWLMSLADLISLLLTFFVMLYSTQQIQKSKFEEMSQSLITRLNPTISSIHIRNEPVQTSQHIEEIYAINLDYLRSILKDKLAVLPDFKDTQIRRLEDRLTLALPAEVFDASLTLTQEAKAQLDILARVLSSIGNRVEIVGYDTAGSIPASLSPSHAWEATITLANSVATELNRAGYAYPITVFGLGQNKSHNLSTNSIKPAAKKSAASIHVDIVIRETLARE